MKCAECGSEIPFLAEHCAVLVVREDQKTGLAVSWHCQHSPFDENDPTIIAILNSAACADKWYKRWYRRRWFRHQNN